MPDHVVVDGDGHVFEPADLWVERMDAGRWGDWIPRKETVEEFYETTWVGGEVRGGGRELIDSVCERFGITPEEYWNLTAVLRTPGGGDPDARIEDMDRDGIDVAVLYPSMAMFFGPLDPIPALHDIDFVTDCIRAYNDWIADYCRAHPGRLFPIGSVPLQDLDRAIAEAQRAVGELGAVGIFIRPSAYVDDLPFSHEVYDPFWAACQELGVPVAFHPGVHTDTPGACRQFALVREDPNMMAVNMNADPVHGGAGLGQAVGNTADMVVTLGRMLMGGVCERFPDLRLLFLESGGGWVPTQLQRMDEQVEAFPLEGSWLSMKPSEYFRRQCWVSFEPEEWNLAACAEWLGPDRVLWASDYPHPEYHPGVVNDLHERIADLPADDQARIAGGNAIEAYRLPV